MPQGRIEIIIGPMFSGKTTELIRRIKRMNLADKKCLVIKYKSDNRYSVDSISTHDHQLYKASSCENLLDLKNLVDSYDTIGIDEGQFFTDLLEFCDLCVLKGKTIIVSGLDADFKLQPFGKIIHLIPKAESVVKLTSVCMLCKSKEGFFSQKISGDKDLIQDIGGSEKYISVCRECHFTTSQKN